jgi:hypothetical protein
MKLIRLDFYSTDTPIDLSERAICDMLRYDFAFFNERVPCILAFPVFNTKRGRLGGNITFGRWHTYGVRKIEFLYSYPRAAKTKFSHREGCPTNVAPQKTDIETVDQSIVWVCPDCGAYGFEHNQMMLSTDAWITYRHPVSDGRRDYRELTKVTLKQFVDGTDNDLRLYL